MEQIFCLLKLGCAVEHRGCAQTCGMWLAILHTLTGGPFARMQDGGRPLLHAAYLGHGMVVALLLAAGAERNYQDRLDGSSVRSHQAGPAIAHFGRMWFVGGC